MKKIENLLQEVKSKELPDPTRRHLSLLTISLAHRIARGEEEWIMPWQKGTLTFDASILQFCVRLITQPARSETSTEQQKLLSSTSE